MAEAGQARCEAGVPANGRQVPRRLPRIGQPRRALPARLVAGAAALAYLAGAAAVMSSPLVEVGGGLAHLALLAMMALQLLLGLMVGRAWAYLLCAAPGLLALIPGLLPTAPDVPGYDILFAVTWLTVGLPVAVVLTMAGAWARGTLGQAAGEPSGSRR